MWIYPVIAKADLRVFEEIDCFEFDAASLPVVHEVGGSHLVSFHHRVLICFHLPFPHLILNPDSSKAILLA